MRRSLAVAMILIMTLSLITQAQDQTDPLDPSGPNYITELQTQLSSPDPSAALASIEKELAAGDFGVLEQPGMRDKVIAAYKNNPDLIKVGTAGQPSLADKVFSDPATQIPTEAMAVYLKAGSPSINFADAAGGQNTAVRPSGGPPPTSLALTMAGGQVKELPIVALAADTKIDIVNNEFILTPPSCDGCFGTKIDTDMFKSSFMLSTSANSITISNGDGERAMTVTGGSVSAIGTPVIVGSTVQYPINTILGPITLSRAVTDVAAGPFEISGAVAGINAVGRVIVSVPPGESQKIEVPENGHPGYSDVFSQTGQSGKAEILITDKGIALQGTNYIAARMLGDTAQQSIQTNPDKAATLLIGDPNRPDLPSSRTTINTNPKGGNVISSVNSEATMTQFDASGRVLVQTEMHSQFQGYINPSTGLFPQVFVAPVNNPLPGTAYPHYGRDGTIQPGTVESPTTLTYNNGIWDTSSYALNGAKGAVPVVSASGTYAVMEGGYNAILTIKDANGNDLPIGQSVNFQPLAVQVQSPHEIGQPLASFITMPWMVNPFQQAGTAANALGTGGGTQTIPVEGPAPTAAEVAAQDRAVVNSWTTPSNSLAALQEVLPNYDQALQTAKEALGQTASDDELAAQIAKSENLPWAQGPAAGGPAVQAPAATVSLPAQPTPQLNPTTPQLQALQQQYKNDIDSYMGRLQEAMTNLGLTKVEQGDEARVVAEMQKLGYDLANPPAAAGVTGTTGGTGAGGSTQSGAQAPPPSGAAETDPGLAALQQAFPDYAALKIQALEALGPDATPLDIALKIESLVATGGAGAKSAADAAAALPLVTKDIKVPVNPTLKDIQNWYESQYKDNGFRFADTKEQARLALAAAGNNNPTDADLASAINKELTAGGVNIPTAQAAVDQVQALKDIKFYLKQGWSADPLTDTDKAKVVAREKELRDWVKELKSRTWENNEADIDYWTKEADKFARILRGSDALKGGVTTTVPTLGGKTPGENPANALAATEKAQAAPSGKAPIVAGGDQAANLPAAVQTAVGSDTTILTQALTNLKITTPSTQWTPIQIDSITTEVTRLKRGK